MKKNLLLGVMLAAILVAVPGCAKASDTKTTVKTERAAGAEKARPTLSPSGKRVGAAEADRGAKIRKPGLGKAGSKVDSKVGSKVDGKAGSKVDSKAGGKVDGKVGSKVDGKGGGKVGSKVGGKGGLVDKGVGAKNKRPKSQSGKSGG